MRHFQSGSPEKNHIVECNTGGLAFLDYDIDGDMDLFIVNGSSLDGYPEGTAPKSALFRNDTNWVFTNVADSAGIAHEGWGMGVTAVDYNADGYTDLYLSNYGPNAMYKNNGDGTFKNVGAAIGVDYSGWSSAASFADYDNDGDSDIYLTNWGKDQLYVNRESKKFVDSLVPTSDMNMLIKRSDFLAVACPLTPKTENMIDKKVFKMMKKSAVIINTSRGGIINEDDLIQALKNKDISGAALDVYAIEPLDPKSELFDIKNVLMSPHISGNFSRFLINSISQE